MYSWLGITPLEMEVTSLNLIFLFLWVPKLTHHKKKKENKKRKVKDEFVGSRHIGCACNLQIKKIVTLSLTSCVY